MEENNPTPEPAPEPGQTSDLIIAETSPRELLERFNNLIDERESAMAQLAQAHANYKAKKEDVAAIESAIFEVARTVRNGCTPLPLLDAPAS